MTDDKLAAALHGAPSPDIEGDALDYARTYWQHGREPRSQAALTVLAHTVLDLRAKMAAPDPTEPTPGAGPVEDVAREEAIRRATNVSEWHPSPYADGYVYGFERGATWQADREADLRAEVTELTEEVATQRRAFRAWQDEGREVTDAKAGETYAAEVNQGVLLASEEARRRAWESVFRKATALLAAPSPGSTPGTETAREVHPEDCGCRLIARPAECCGRCPEIAGGGYDCTCKDNPRCTGPETHDGHTTERSGS